MLITIPFSGFYESLHNSNFDEELGSEAETMATENGLLVSDCVNALYRFADFRTMRVEYAKAYVDEFCKAFENETGIKLSLEFESLNSPKEYNFSTDRIFCNITQDDVKLLHDSCGDRALRDSAKERFTSRSGFISFYNPNPDTWGDVTTWDHNQLETMLVGMLDESCDWEQIEANIACYEMPEKATMLFINHCGYQKALEHCKSDKGD